MFWCSSVGADRLPKEAMPVARQKYLGFGVLCWERKVIRAEKIADGRSHFPPGQGAFRKIGVQFWRKVDVAGYTVYPVVFRTRQGESGRRPIGSVRFTL